MQKLFLPILLHTVFIMNSYNESQQLRVGLLNSLHTENMILADTTEIKALIEKYKQSIDNADTVLASKLWAHTEEVSFISSRGHQHGWEEIKNHVYKLFTLIFSQQKLNSYNEKINIYNDVAWSEFYFEFNATLKEGMKPIQSKGIETQIWRKIRNEWRLVLVHTSDLPVLVN